MGQQEQIKALVALWDVVMTSEAAETRRAVSRPHSLHYFCLLSFMLLTALQLSAMGWGGGLLSTLLSLSRVNLPFPSPTHTALFSHSPLPLPFASHPPPAKLRMALQPVSLMSHPSSSLLTFNFLSFIERIKIEDASLEVFIFRR